MKIDVPSCVIGAIIAVFSSTLINLGKMDSFVLIGPALSGIYSYFIYIYYFFWRLSIELFGKSTSTTEVSVFNFTAVSNDEQMFNLSAHFSRAQTHIQNHAANMCSLVFSMKEYLNLSNHFNVPSEVIAFFIVDLVPIITFCMFSAAMLIMICCQISSSDRYDRSLPEEDISVSRSQSDETTTSPQNQLQHSRSTIVLPHYSPGLVSRIPPQTPVIDRSDRIHIPDDK